jgi:hypothetical protein
MEAMKKLQKIKGKLVALWVKKKAALVIFTSGLFLGFVAGYLFALNNLSSRILDWIVAIDASLNSLIASASSFLQFSPNVNFLSDVAAFEAAIIALAIPLSFEIVSRISERYQSDVVSRKFDQEKINKALPVVLVINIALAIGLRFYEVEDPTSTAWKLFAWLSFLGFLFVAYLLLRFIGVLKIYMSSTEGVIEKLFKDAENSIQNK